MVNITHNRILRSLTNIFRKSMIKVSRMLMRILKIISVWIRALKVIIFENRKVTHVFFYSEKQKRDRELNIWQDHFGRAYRCLGLNKVCKIPYTEMRKIGLSYSNWDDAKIVYFGTCGGITNYKTKVFIE